METLNFKTLDLVTLSAKQVDAVNGAEPGLLRKEGMTVAILPIGELHHKWSRTSEGPAFRAIAWRKGLDLTMNGWVSPTSLAGGRVLTSVPESWEYQESEDGSWWVAKDLGVTPDAKYGISQAGLPGAVDLDSSSLKGIVIIEISSAPRGVTGKLLPKTQDALDKIKRFQPKAKVWSNKSAKDFPTIGWESKGYWLGTARWATREDLEGRLDNIDSISQYFHH